MKQFEGPYRTNANNPCAARCSVVLVTGLPAGRATPGWAAASKTLQPSHTPPFSCKIERPFFLFARNPPTHVRHPPPPQTRPRPGGQGLAEGPADQGGDRGR